MSKCSKWRESDEYACLCGLRWGVNEYDPHKTVLPEVTAAKIKARNERNRNLEDKANLRNRRCIEDHIERKRLRDELQ